MAYWDLIQVLGRNAPAEFRAVPCPSEEVVDILVIGDSSCAMVEEPNNRYPTKHHVAELLQAEQLKGVRNIYHGMDWGKGLEAIYSTMEAKVRFIAEDNSQKGIKQLPISVYVLWGGNDVFGNYGFVGCRWIHEKSPVLL